MPIIAGGREYGATEGRMRGEPHGNYRDLRGHRNGRLVAIEPVERRHGGHVQWRCRCDCGAEAVVASNNLSREAGTKSCGCLRRDAVKRRADRDGHWNQGKSYPIANGEHVYSTRHSWAKAVVRAKGPACERCGWAAARCDVHHKISRAAGGQHTIANGLVLCPNCHRVEHERRGR